MINKGDLIFKRPARNAALVLLVFIFLLAGCQGQSFLDAVFPRAESDLGVKKLTPEPEESQAVNEGPPTPMIPIYKNLVLWVTPQFDPNDETPSARMLNERIREFLIQNPEVNLEVRIKAANGPGSLMDSLNGASAVAQDALPSLVLLSRTDLVQAVDRGFLFPIEEVSSSVDETDWYELAKLFSIYQGSVYGLPFASNALGVIYRENELLDSQPSWDEVLRSFDKMVFPAGDVDAIVTFALYQSAGGVLDAQNTRSKIDLDALSAALGVYESARKAGALNGDVLEYMNDDQAWAAFLRNNSDAAITWANRQFSAEDGLQLALLPFLGENPFTYGTGWAWCLTEPDSQKRAYAAALAEFLSAPDFLARWAPISGYLPVRPSSLDGYQGENLRSVISTMLMSARLRPDRYIIEGISLEVKTAVSEVINGVSSTAESATALLKRLEESDK